MNPADPAKHRHRRSRRQSGVTLTGLMVGMAVGTIVLSATLTAYLMISEGARDSFAEARLNQELRAALDLMKTDIRRAGYWDYLDTSDDGDLDGSGRLDVWDLFLERGAAGAFDADGDGDSDDRDLSPVSNPFQRRYQSVNNDVCIDTAAESGECAAANCVDFHASGACRAFAQAGSCITYSYDLDSDARVGIRACGQREDEGDCPAPAGGPLDGRRGEPFAWRSWLPPDRSPKVKSIEMEMFGFRRRGTAVQMRVGRSGRADLALGCDAGRWERITSHEVVITDLSFRLRSEATNASADKGVSDPCESGDLCRYVRTVEIELAGRPAGRRDAGQRLSARVAIRNDRYTEIP